MTLTGLAILYRRLFVPPAQEGNIVRGAAVGDPARVRADIVNFHGHAFGNPEQNPHADVVNFHGHAFGNPEQNPNGDVELPRIRDLQNTHGQGNGH